MKDIYTLETDNYEKPRTTLHTTHIYICIWKSEVTIIIITNHIIIARNES